VSPSFGALDGEQCVAAEGPDVGRALGHVVWAEGAGDRRCLTHLAAFRSGAELLLTLNAGFRSRAGLKQRELTIGQVAKRATSTARVRFYERVGVLPAPERVSGQRRYGEETVRRLEMIDMDELRRLLKAQRCSCFSLELCALFAGDDAA
jgi:hypothetical protein